MAYANQVIGGGDGRDGRARLAAAGASGVIVADLTPDEGAPFEAVARDVGLAVVYLVAPDDRARRRARDRRPDRRLPLLRVARRRHRRPDEPARVGRAARPRRPGRVSPVPVAVGFGVSRPAHVRALVEAGADGVIVASALVDALGPDGRDVAALGRLVADLRARRPSALTGRDASRSIEARRGDRVQADLPLGRRLARLGRGGKDPRSRPRGVGGVRRTLRSRGGAGR